MAGVKVPRALSGKHKEDFAYATIKDRLPDILTKALDSIYRSKEQIAEKHGEEGSEALKSIIGRMSQLKNELQTDKPFRRLQDKGDDVARWDTYLDEDKHSQEDQRSSWFSSTWLYAECYFYRRIHECVQVSNVLQHLDPFSSQKQQQFIGSQEAVESLAEFLHQTISDPDSKEEVKKLFLSFLQVALWGNKCDLSISAGAENNQKLNALTELDKLQSNILHDDSEKVWAHLDRLRHNKPGQVRLDIVLDNAGFELFCDLSFADFLITANLVSTIHMHGKKIPWFVSDVTREDFHWTLNQMALSSNMEVVEVYQRWQKHLKAGVWVFKDDLFWTLPHEFPQMKTTAKDLYSDLAQADLILFKGDLNYRKLMGDRKWDPTVPFDAALHGFHPAPLCTLRTLKCDMVVGLREGIAEETQRKSKEWMLTGSHAVIQFCDKQDN